MMFDILKPLAVDKRKGRSSWCVERDRHPAWSDLVAFACPQNAYSLAEGFDASEEKERGEDEADMATGDRPVECVGAQPGTVPALARSAVRPGLAKLTAFRSTSDGSDRRDSARRSRAPATYAEFKGDPQFATTLARGLELLRCFSPDRPVLSNREMSQLLDLPAPTVSRLTYTLTCMGYLTQDGAYGKYRLGSAVLCVGYPLLELFSTMRQRARPLMEALAQQTGGSISIGIRERLGIVLIEAVRSHRPTSYPVDIGTTHSLAGTALGRAYLVALTTDDRQNLLNLVRTKAPDEWARYGDNLLANLARYPDLGYCTSLGEVRPDVFSIAVPLGRIGGKEAAAITCSFHGRAPDERYLLEEIGPKLLSLARRLA